MFADTWLLLTLRWHVGWNTFRHRKLAAQIFSILGGLIFAGVISLGFFGLGVALGLLLKDFPDRDIAALIPGGLLTALTLLMLLTSFGVALGTLFLANDLELLMTAPVDRRSVFLSKMIDSMLPNYGILLVMALPALIAFGIGQGWGLLYYLLVLVTIAVLPLLPAGLGALLVLLVARVAPVRRVREILGFAGALFGIGCGLIGQTTRYWVPGLVSTPGSTPPDPQQLADSVRGWASVPLPPLMAGRGLASAGYGDWPMLAVSFGGFLFITVGIFVGCVWVADRLYASGWVRMQSSGSAKRGKERSARAAARSGWLGSAPAWFAIALKDWRVIPRDLRNFAQMLAPLALLPFVFLSIVTGGGGRPGRPGRNPFGDVTEGTLGVFVAAGVLVAVLFVFGRMAETSISMEGKSWWLTKAAPMSPWEVLFGKLVAAAVPYVIVSVLFMIAADIWRHFDFVWFLYGLFGVEMLGLGLLAVAVGLSVPWAKLDWDDPRKMLPWQTALLTLAAWLIIGLISGLLLCLPFFIELFNQPNLVAIMMPLGALMSTLVTGLLAYGFLRWGVQSFNKVDEP